MKTKNKFEFWCPVEISKAKNDKGEEVMRIGGIASTKDEDADGEFLDPSGFDISEFNKSGVVNWHHQAKNSPATIIGEPSKSEIRKDGFYVETDLYPSSELAQEVYELAQTLSKDSKTRRLGYSIEGVVLERDPINPKRVTKAKITGLAITHMPKNAQTFADIIKGFAGEEDEEVEEKSLDTEGGAALTKESIAGLEKGKKALIGEVREWSGKKYKKTTSGWQKLPSEKKTEKKMFVDEGTGEEFEVDVSTEEKVRTTSPSREKKIKEEEKVLTNLNNKETYVIKSMDEESMKNKISETFSGITVEKAREVLFFINKIKDEMSKNNKITDEKLEKAFEILGIESNGKNPFLEKATTIGTADETKGGKTTIIEKDEEEDEDSKVDPKTEAFIKKMFDGGTGEEEEDEEEEDEEGIEKSYSPDIIKAIESVKEDNFKSSKAVAVLVKAQMDAFGNLLEKFGTLEEDLKETKSQLKKATETIDRIGGQSQGRKSLTKGYIERKFDGQQDILSKGFSVVSGRKQISEILDNATFAKGGYDEEFSKALTSFEAGGEISENVKSRLKNEFKVVIQ